MTWSVCSKESLVVLIVISILSTMISCTNKNNPPKIHIGLPYSQIKGTDNAFIHINLVYPKTYKIELAKELDRETFSVFQVQIVCSDKGNPVLTARESFTVNVVDVNDNSPVFGQSSYSVNVTEGVDAGTFVTVITATDSDAELNGVVQYSFFNDSSDNSSTFNIDKNSGHIFTNSEIDRENVSEYTLTVVATDSGSPARSSTVEVKISVDDINDNTPIVTTKEIHVKENQKPMIMVGKIFGSDLDVGKNAQLVFSKVENSESSSMTPFLVQPNGEILSAVSLNREQMPQYIMEIEVKDRGSPRKNSTATLVIIVDDVNDNIPVITSACFNNYSIDNYTFADNSSSSSGVVIIDWFVSDDKKVIYQVKANDQDLGDNAQIRFSIDSLDNNNNSGAKLKDNLFKINGTTGEIFLGRDVRKTDQLHHIINISVSDRGDPTLTSFCALSIIIKVDIKQLGTSKTTKVKVKSHKRTRKYRNSSSRLGFLRVKYLATHGDGVVCFLLACILVNSMFRFLLCHTI
ncbi:unnamed protein product [Candidula unifasciata]|uniref:Cadherin domain-containing protein n=1 Tax=Candidula unifasciata TaxID=100452 RepID=A0A8S4A493_9EUPU|nr:unnamed protein product [Candidula unifasciata]